MDVLQALRSLEGGEPFGCIFMDAPYGMGLEKDVLYALSGSDLIDSYTTIIIEENIDTDLSYIDSIPRLHIEKNKQYKTNKHVFISVTE